MWQITHKLLLELTTSSNRDQAKNAFDAMMTMKKIDIATIKAAVETKWSSRFPRYFMPNRRYSLDSRPVMNMKNRRKSLMSDQNG